VEPISSSQSTDERTLAFPTEDTVPIEKLQQLCKNEQLKSLIKGNTHLQQLLLTIDRSPDPSSLLKQAVKQDSDFQRFSSICLKTVGSDSNDQLRDADDGTIAHLLNSLQSASSDDFAKKNNEEAVASFLTLLSDHFADDSSDVGSLFRK